MIDLTINLDGDLPIRMRVGVQNSVYQVFLASYATDRFEPVRRELNASARQFGITEHFSFTENDLHASDYYWHNKSILDEECGAGFWAWKPYFILKALNDLSDDDVLFYADAGSRFLQPPAPLIDICTHRPDGLLLFDARPLTNAQFTKRDCFVRLNCDYPDIWGSNKVIATLLLIRKCARSVEFLSEWVKHCQDRSVITDDVNKCGRPNLPTFLQHRHDQAILSVMAARDGIETYRNPTFQANYLKLPQFRIRGEPLLSPYGLLPAVNGYSKTPQANSPYGTIFEINRVPNTVGKLPLPLSAQAVGRQNLLSISSMRRLGERIRRKVESVLQ